MNLPYRLRTGDGRRDGRCDVRHCFCHLVLLLLILLDLLLDAAGDLAEVGARFGNGYCDPFPAFVGFEFDAAEVRAENPHEALEFYRLHFLRHADAADDGHGPLFLYPCTRPFAERPDLHAPDEVAFLAAVELPIADEFDKRLGGRPLALDEDGAHRVHKARGHIGDELLDGLLVFGSEFFLIVLDEFRAQVNAVHHAVLDQQPNVECARGKILRAEEAGLPVIGRGADERLARVSLLAGRFPFENLHAQALFGILDLAADTCGKGKANGDQQADDNKQKQ